MPQEIVCQTCGDRGFPEALNYCIMCMETAEHTYCLEKLPEVLNEDIYWTCEICLSKTVGDSSLHISVVTVDRVQYNGTSEGKAPCLRKGKEKQPAACSAHKNAATNTQSTTRPSQTRPKRVRKPAPTNTESTADSAQTRSKRVRKTAASNTQQKVASQSKTRPAPRKRRGRK